jgi:dienelactone hydrolase
MVPQVVKFSSGSLHLTGYLWKPPGAGPFPAVLFNHGSGGEDPNHTAGMQITEAAEILAPFFVKHGYAFFYPFRRGYGPSADQAPFLQDVLRQEEKARGTQARQHLQFVLTTTDQINDVLAALAFLKSAPGIDPHRIAVAGHSLGGQLTILAAEADPGIRAAITFAGAAGSWERSPEVRERLTAAVQKTKAAVLLICAENDYSTAPARALAGELERLHKPYSLKIYGPVGLNSDDGHGMLYLDIPAWQEDVFRFLDEYVSAQPPHEPHS